MKYFLKKYLQENAFQSLSISNFPEEYAPLKFMSDVLFMGYSSTP